MAYFTQGAGIPFQPFAFLLPLLSTLDLPAEAFQTNRPPRPHSPPLLSPSKASSEAYGLLVRMAPR